MANDNNSTTNWEPLQGGTMAPFGTNTGDAPKIPKSFPVEVANILIENGADVQLVDKENRIIMINGEITEDMIPDLIASFFGDEYWQQVRNQDNLGQILTGALGCFEMEAVVEQEGVLKIRGRVNLEALDGLDL